MTEIEELKAYTKIFVRLNRSGAHTLNVRDCALIAKLIAKHIDGILRERLGARQATA